MAELIAWNELPTWVPGRVLLASDGLGWKNVGLRSYGYRGQDVIVPAMRDYMLVGYGRGVTPMRRRFDGKWRRETLSPGAVAVSRLVESRLFGVEPLDTGVYLIAALFFVTVAFIATAVPTRAATRGAGGGIGRPGGKVSGCAGQAGRTGVAPAPVAVLVPDRGDLCLPRWRTGAAGSGALRAGVGGGSGGALAQWADRDRIADRPAGLADCAPDALIARAGLRDADAALGGPRQRRPWTRSSWASRRPAAVASARSQRSALSRPSAFTRRSYSGRRRRR